MLHQGPATPVPMARNAAAVDQETPWCEKHQQIVCDEIEAINTRREPERRLDADGLRPASCSTSSDLRCPAAAFARRPFVSACSRH